MVWIFNGKKIENGWFLRNQKLFTKIECFWFLFFIKKYFCPNYYSPKKYQPALLEMYGQEDTDVTHVYAIIHLDT